MYQLRLIYYDVGHGVQYFCGYCQGKTSECKGWIMVKSNTDSDGVILLYRDTILTTLHYTTLHYTTLRYAMLCYAMLCYAMLYYTILVKSN